MVFGKKCCERWVSVVCARVCEVCFWINGYQEKISFNVQFYSCECIHIHQEKTFFVVKFCSSLSEYHINGLHKWRHTPNSLAAKPCKVNHLQWHFLACKAMIIHPNTQAHTHKYTHTHWKSTNHTEHPVINVPYQKAHTGTSLNQTAYIHTTDCTTEHSIHSHQHTHTHTYVISCIQNSPTVQVMIFHLSVTTEALVFQQCWGKKYAHNITLSHTAWKSQRSHVSVTIYSPSHDIFHLSISTGSSLSKNSS
jgi:hypothetical protein